MAFDVKKEARQLVYEGRWLVHYALRLAKMSETVARSAAKIEEQAAEIERLSSAIHDLQANEKLAIARMEAAVVRAAADAPGDLSRRLGFLEGRASRE